MEAKSMMTVRHVCIVAALLACTRPARADDAAAPADSKQPIASPRLSPSKALPVTLVVVGGLAMIGGGIAIAFDEDAYAAPAGQPQPATYIDSAPPGIIALASGAVFASAGAYLLWSQRRVKTAPTLDVRTGGAVIGVAHSW